jgi:hypothetical protein
VDGDLVATCVWRASAALLVTLDDTFGPPLDTYVNGSQVWLREDGPDDLVLEWRLHPVGGYVRPKGVATEDVFERTALALARDEAPPAPLERLWEGLECFAAYGDELEPMALAAAATAALGLPPDAVGLVAHEPIAEEWERTERRSSIVARLLEQLAAPPA